MTPHTILCPIDFSDQSRHALRVAGALAARYQSRLIVLSAVEPMLAEAARASLKLDLAKTETEPALAAFVKETWPGDAPPVTPVLEVRVGKSDDVILDAAARDSADLIVMGTQGLGGIRKWLVGSTTEHVLRRTTVAVLAVPPATHATSPLFGQGPILAATDLTESSVAAASDAAELARKFDIPLLIAHIVEPVTVPPQWRSLLEESDEARTADARAQLEQLAGQLPGGRLERIVLFGHPADTIVALAEERKPWLIVMGLTGHQGPFSRRPGSIAYRVLSSSRTPVLIVPPTPA
jgi:nucleotide-binding universal stress UspA family protein